MASAKKTTETTAAKATTAPAATTTTAKPAAAPKAKTPAKKAEKSEAPAAPIATVVPTVNGVELSFGDLKGGGTAKSPLIAMLALKSITVQKGFNPRLKFNGIEELSASIKKDGLLSALVVRPGDKDGQFVLVAGERRLRALQALGVDSVPVLVRTDLKTDDQKAKAAAVAENSEDGRYNLNAIELGRVFAELEKGGWTVARIAGECNVETQKVRRCLTLMQAPEDVRLRVEAGTMSVAPALELAKLDPATREKIKGSLSEDTSANEVRRLAKEAGKETATDAETHDGKSAKKKKGASRAASLAVWKGSKEKQSTIAMLCSLLNGATAEEKDSSDFSEMRGAVAALLWDRGDLSDVTLPAAGTADAKEIKLLKTFDAIVAAEAKKHTPPAEAAAAAG